MGYFLLKTPHVKSCYANESMDFFKAIARCFHMTYNACSIVVPERTFIIHYNYFI